MLRSRAFVPVALARDRAHRARRVRVTRSRLLALGIALALADSSVVTLALPDILRRFDLEIAECRVGADDLQPRACGCRRSGCLCGPSATGDGIRRRDSRVRDGIARVRACADLCMASRRPDGAGCRWGAADLRRARASLRGRALRRRGGQDLGRSRDRGRCARPCRRWNPDADARLGVDLLRASAPRTPYARRGSRHQPRAPASARGAPVDPTERGAACCSPGHSPQRCSCSCCSSSTAGG